MYNGVKIFDGTPIPVFSCSSIWTFPIVSPWSETGTSWPCPLLHLVACCLYNSTNTSHHTCIHVPYFPAAVNKAPLFHLRADCVVLILFSVSFYERVIEETLEYMLRLFIPTY